MITEAEHGTMVLRLQKGGAAYLRRENMSVLATWELY